MHLARAAARLTTATLLLSSLACSPEPTPVLRQEADLSPRSDVAGRPGPVETRWYYPREEAGPGQLGLATWYGARFEGRRTGSGEIFDKDSFTAAHRTLPFASLVRVTNLANGRSVVVRINDRGPFGRGRIIDVSYAAARALGFHRHGITRVRITLLDTGAAGRMARR